MTMLPSATTSKLARLVKEAAELDAEVKEKIGRLDLLKEQIRAAVEQYKDQIPIVSASRTIPLSTIGKALRVTYTTGAPRMDYDALRDRVGAEVFMQITEPTAWEIVPDKVNQALADELVTETALAECLKEPPVRRPSVTWDVLKGTKIGADD